MMLTQTVAVTTVEKKATWQKILSDSYKKPQDLLRDLGLPDADVSADALFATRVPKPFVDKMQRGNPNDPLLLQVLPHADEFTVTAGFSNDPLNEQAYNKIAGLLHKYQTRVLLTLQGACAVNCRYCFRRHFDYGENRISQTQLREIVDYIAKHPEINEVILSGGDPLMSKDKQLANMIEQFEALPQLKRIRFHTRLPVVIPERITDAFASMLGRTRLQAIVVLHCNHPNEIDENFNAHAQKLSENGVQLLNQGVLLKGINDHADVLAALSEKLFDARILPYYLFLLDKVSGAGHFDVSETVAKQLIRDMAAQLPGFLVPKLARETAGLPSKDMWV